MIIRPINLLRFTKQVTSRVQRRFLNFNIFGRSPSLNKLILKVLFDIEFYIIRNGVILINPDIISVCITQTLFNIKNPFNIKINS